MDLWMNNKEDGSKSQLNIALHWIPYHMPISSVLPLGHACFQVSLVASDSDGSENEDNMQHAIRPCSWVILDLTIRWLVKKANWIVGLYFVTEELLDQITDWLAGSDKTIEELVKVPNEFWESVHTQDMLLLVDIDIETEYPPIEPCILFQAPVKTSIFRQNYGQGTTLEHLRVFDLSSRSFMVNPDQNMTHDHPIDLRNSPRYSDIEEATWVFGNSERLQYTATPHMALTPLLCNGQATELGI
ncbi:hypothetical protein HETIRDRAFT_119088 [Heterobasidion irregulare TC 32-1]|uniref:Uncharacterized protein n=1 Tax=Heterobasidion irregulare (strain TC 32-1) TaxID=747525 RepID=W4JQ53_HETIT|nr:uncharacterized protein HETIRDRAFT_119088 [Heterobasidion irregulare TC 32-1]ETW75692.1 hypothetical protein HETIRDRAFT_119088 [Heterobasidion irregulare TC 32-1]